MRESRWLWLNGMEKKNLTDIDPMSKEDEDRMNKYIDENISKFEVYNNPKGLTMKELIELISSNALL